MVAKGRKGVDTGLFLEGDIRMHRVHISVVWVAVSTVIAVALIALWLHFSRQPLSPQDRLTRAQQHFLSATPVAPSSITSPLLRSLFQIVGNMPVEQRQAMLRGQVIRVADLPSACRLEVAQYLRIASGSHAMEPSFDAAITTESRLIGDRSVLVFHVYSHGHDYPVSLEVVEKK